MKSLLSGKTYPRTLSYNTWSTNKSTIHLLFVIAIIARLAEMGGKK